MQAPQEICCQEQMICIHMLVFHTRVTVNGACLSRKHLLSQVEESLNRLQTSYIDLYQWHCWDSSTPLEESLRTMDDLIKQGKIRYFGVSNFCGWQLQKVIQFCPTTFLVNVTRCF